MDFLIGAKDSKMAADLNERTIRSSGFEKAIKKSNWENPTYECAFVHDARNRGHSGTIKFFP